MLQGGDARHDVLGFLRGLVFIEIAGHGDLIADLRLLLVDPGVGRVGQHLALEIALHVLRQGDVFRVAEIGVRHRLAALQDDLALRVTLRPLHGDLAVAEGLVVKDLALAVNARLVAVDGVVLEFPVGPDDQFPAEVGDIVALGAD